MSEDQTICDVTDLVREASKRWRETSIEQMFSGKSNKPLVIEILDEPADCKHWISKQHD